MPMAINAWLFQSTLPLRGATVDDDDLVVAVEISIHTPLAGSDLYHRASTGQIIQFQSTLPLRGAIWSRTRRPRCRHHFNPRSPCGERHQLVKYDNATVKFQSTLPLRGATTCAACGRPRYRFQSTLPLRGATALAVAGDLAPVISIHTPLAGSDWTGGPSRCSTRYFNPHSPCGERRAQGYLPVYLSQFQSTLPLRGATLGKHLVSHPALISIHTPLAGSDARIGHRGAVHLISIHTPLAGSDARFKAPVNPPVNFNPHSPCGERHIPDVP